MGTIADTKKSRIKHLKKKARGGRGKKKKKPKGRARCSHDGKNQESQLREKQTHPSKSKEKSVRKKKKKHHLEVRVTRGETGNQKTRDDLQTEAPTGARDAKKGNKKKENVAEKKEAC